MTHKERVVCSAIRLDDGYIVLGARHFDKSMHDQLKRLGVKAPTAEQGFINQLGEFLTREKALDVAKEAGQILKKHPPCNKLFSEDLY